MKSLIIFIAIFFCLITVTSSLGQGNYSRCPDYQIDIRKTGTQATISVGGLIHNPTCNPSYGIWIGKNQTTHMRGVYQWSTYEIPVGSTINSITIEFSVSSQTFHPLKYFNVPSDITSPSLDLEDLYNATHYFLDGIGVTSSLVTNGVNSTTFTGAADPFVIAFTNALSQGLFTMGFAWRYDGPTAGDVEYLVSPRVSSLTVDFTPPAITIDQKLSNGQQVGVLRKWEESESEWSDEFLPGSQFYFPVSSQQTLLGDQNIHSNQKYNIWKTITGDEDDVTNHYTFTIRPNDNNFTSQFAPTYSGVTIKNALEGTSVTGGTLAFRDPWLIDYTDGSFGGQKRNRGMVNAEFKSRTSPFYPDYNTVYDGGNKYQGVFLNQEIAANKSYYDVWAGDGLINLGSPIGLRQFYMQGWSATGADLQHFGLNQAHVVFTSGNAVVQANLKGQGLSNDPIAYNSNSQRKVVKLYNGYLISIYKSMDKVWLEKSTDNGTTWNMWNFGNPFDDGYEDVITPSIDEIPWAEAHSFAAVIHYDYVSTGIKVNIIRTKYSGSQLQELLGINYEPNVDHLAPVIAVTSNQILAVCNGGMDQYQQAGLVYYFGSITNSPVLDITWTDGHFSPNYKVIPGTSQYSKNPAIVADKNAGNIFHLVWEDRGSIKYCKATGSGGSLSFSSVETISTSSGYGTHVFPSISLANGNPVVSWTGSGVADIEKRISKVEGGEPVGIPKAIIRRKGTSWGDFQFAGSYVNFANNNSVNTATEKTVIVWSEGSTNPQSKWIKRTNGQYSTPLSLSHSGIQTQVISGSDYQYMTSVVRSEERRVGKECRSRWAP